MEGEDPKHSGDASAGSQIQNCPPPKESTKKRGAESGAYQCEAGRVKPEQREGSGSEPREGYQQSHTFQRVHTRRGSSCQRTWTTFGGRGAEERGTYRAERTTRAGVGGAEKAGN